MGVYPNTFLEFLHVPVQEILDRVTPALPEAGAGGFAQVVELAKGLF
jgi:hypothetical protein